MPFALRSKKCFMPSPAPKTAVWANVYYTRATGLEKMCLHYYETRDDLYDHAFVRYSPDNGRTWSAAQEIRHQWQTDKGTVRTWRHGGGWGIFTDPERNLMVRIYNEAVLPSDSVKELLKHSTMRYAVSGDGGRTNLHEEQIIQKGAGFDAMHPLPFVWIGRNSVHPGGPTCVPIRNGRGQILQPVDITPIGAKGEYVNPGGGRDYCNAAVLIGTWTADNRLEWELSQMVIADFQRTTRGNMETTLARMADGRILMVLRGSNDSRPELPGVRWFSVSHDEGVTWAQPQPWRTTDGEVFYSPSSSSLLFQHSNGHTYWLANIVAENPRGNSPRYPLCIAEVDPASLQLRRESVFAIEDRQPDNHPDVQFSNFVVHEDRETAEIVVNCTRFLTQGLAAWDGDAYEYRVTV